LGTSGCTALEAAKFLLPSASNGLEVDAELTVGDKQEDINTQVGDKVSNTADTIINQQDIPLSWILLFTLMAGWAIPSPSEMGKGLMIFMRALLPWTR
jgi:hypothetical protein